MGSLQCQVAFLGDVGGNKNKQKICLLAHVGKIKIISTYFAYFLIELLPIGKKNLLLLIHVILSEEKKTQKAVFFLVGAYFIFVGGLVEHRI